MRKLGELREWHIPTAETGAQGMFIGYAYGMPVVLDPRNTYIRIFGEGDNGPYNQIVHTLPGFDTAPLVFPLNHAEMEELKPRLLNEGYPVYHSHEPDEKVLLWFRQVLEMERQENPDL